MQNFGKIKNAFNELLAEGLSTNNPESKRIFKKYIKAINENEILRTQFLVYNNIKFHKNEIITKLTNFTKTRRLRK